MSGKRVPQKGRKYRNMKKVRNTSESPFEASAEQCITISDDCASDSTDDNSDLPSCMEISGESQENCQDNLHKEGELQEIEDLEGEQFEENEDPQGIRNLQVIQSSQVFKMHGENTNADGLFKECSSIPTGDFLLPVESIYFEEPNVCVNEKNNKNKKSKHTFSSVSREEFDVLMRKVVNIENRVNETYQILKTIEGLLQTKLELVPNKIEFTDKYELDLPFKTVDQVNNFERQLAMDPECRKDTKMMLQSFIDPGEKASRNVTGILKKFMRRDVAMRYTATRQMEEKIAFKAVVPHFCSCIVDTVRSRLNVPESHVFSALGTTFTNSKDWDGQRPNRIKSKGDKTANPDSN